MDPDQVSQTMNLLGRRRRKPGQSVRDFNVEFKDRLKLTEGEGQQPVRREKAAAGRASATQGSQTLFCPVARTAQLEWQEMEEPCEMDGDLVDEHTAQEHHGLHGAPVHFVGAGCGHKLEAGVGDERWHGLQRGYT